MAGNLPCLLVRMQETFETNLTGSRLKKLKIQNLTQMNIKDHEHQRVRVGLLLLGDMMPNSFVHVMFLVLLPLPLPPCAWTVCSGHHASYPGSCRGGRDHVTLSPFVFLCAFDVLCAWCFTTAGQPVRIAFHSAAVELCCRTDKPVVVSAVV